LFASGFATGCGQGGSPNGHLSAVGRELPDVEPRASDRSVEPARQTAPPDDLAATATTGQDEPSPNAEVTGTIVAHAVVDEVVARVAPTPDAAPARSFEHPTSRGGPLVFQALGPPSAGWIEVLLPIRPNGSTGFVAVDDVELTRNPYRITIDVSGFTLEVHRNEELVLSTPVAIGEGDTPTPLGDFYLIELLQPPTAGGPYGPYAYGLSGYSETLESFAGGEGVIGIHGTNRPELLGTRVSHGCVRVANEVITEMAGFLPLGTPVSIG
jgi:lipoprotein-anchoring transpeptidase ErfK/SrfK